MHNTNTEEVLSVESLDVNYKTKGGSVKALRDVSFTLQKGETLGIAGESGSGKSTLAHAILQYLDENGHIQSGTITFKGEDLLKKSHRELRGIRGNVIAHVPQDPEASLNPSIRVGKQIQETILAHTDSTNTEAMEKVYGILEDVNIPDPQHTAQQYPHELSGGMQQRILIGMALSCDPEVLILDEPTTGLDVTIQTKVLDLISELQESYNTSIILITHNLSTISHIGDRLLMLYAGEIMERGSVNDLLNNPTNPYTWRLVESIPRINDDKQIHPIPGQLPDLIDLPQGCIFADRCSFADDECRNQEIDESIVSYNPEHTSRCRKWETVSEKFDSEPIKSQTQKNTSATNEILLKGRNVKKQYGEKSFFDRLFNSDSPVKAVNEVDIDIYEGETLGLVGESGCGKSTLGQSLLRLLDVTDGTVQFRGEDVTTMSGSDLTEFRANAQIVFQNPHSSLNPRKTINQILKSPLKELTDLTSDERKTRIQTLLDQVGIDSDYLSRYPHNLSGGEKQRIAIARAFAPNPSLIVLDEPVSALDVSVQANILNLLVELQEEYGTSYLFISHDLGVIKYISDRIAVMYLGDIVEIGSNEAIFEPPYHPYTRALLSNVLTPDPDGNNNPIRLEGDVPSPRDSPSGCPFHTRCPQKIDQTCEEEIPELEEVNATPKYNHYISCHLSIEEMNEELNNSLK
jgi:peptide/nickel transport system ATP-binding protein